LNSAQTFHLISGLPRSGSTLLAALLKQNPHFHAGMTSPVGSLYKSMLEQVSVDSEFGPVITQEQRQQLLRGLFTAYYQEQHDKQVIFDTNRSWCSHLSGILTLFPQAKIIACVRNVAWVMDSMERLYQANPFENTKLFADANERSNVYSRVDTLAQRNRLVGFSWAALKEAYYGANAQSLLLIDYDLLTQKPETVLRLIYEFIGQPWFEHDFDNVVYDAPEFDHALGVPGLHKVQPKVAPQHRRTILPPDLFEQYSKLSFWQDGPTSLASVIRVKQSD